VSRQEQGPYDFGPSLPLDAVPPGTTLLVSGPSLSRAHALGLQLVLAGPAAEGRILLVPEGDGGDLLAQCRELNSTPDYGRLCLVATEGGDGEARTELVGSAADLAELGLAFSSFYEDLHGEGVGRVRTGVVSVSALLDATDLRTAFRFLNTVAGRITSADGLGVLVLDPTDYDDRTVGTLSQVADGRVEVRGVGEETPELRVAGLDDQPDGWTAF
jgi:hypothetical protein